MVTMSNVSSYSSPKQEKYKCQTFELKQITMGLIEEQEKYIYIKQRRAYAAEIL
jgi:hypothetical protein